TARDPVDYRHQGYSAPRGRAGDCRGCPKLCPWTCPLGRWHARSSGRAGGYRLDHGALALCPQSDAWRQRDVKPSPLSALPRPVLQALLVVLEKVFVLLRKKAVYPFPYNKSTHTISLPAQIERELRRLVSTGNKVEAMKRVISLTGAGLRVSKDYVDQLAKGH